MTRTKIAHESEITTTTGLLSKWPNPIKPELFAGKHEAQLAKAVGITQLGVNSVTLDPGTISALRHWHEVEDEDGEHRISEETVHYPDDDLGPIRR